MSIKYILEANDVRGSILELVRDRAQKEAKWMRNAKTQREEGAHARAFRVLNDLYEDLSKAEVSNAAS